MELCSLKPKKEKPDSITVSERGSGCRGLAPHLLPGPSLHKEGAEGHKYIL